MQDGDPDNIQHVTKGNNVLPLWGDKNTMNLNGLLLTNIVQSPYFSTTLTEISLHSQIVEEIYYNVKHLEPWERGTRQVVGLTGMCGGVRGVGEAVCLGLFGKGRCAVGLVSGIDKQ